MKLYILALIKILFDRFFFQKIFSIFLLAIFLFLFQDFLTLFFLTFIFSYLFLSMGNAVTKKLLQMERGVRNTKVTTFIKKHTTLNTVVSILYIVFIVTITSVITTFIDPFTTEVRDLATQIPLLVKKTQDVIITPIESQFNIRLGITEQVMEMIGGIDYKNLAENTISVAKNIGAFLTVFFGALVLSFIFIIDRKHILAFLKPLEESNFSFLHREYSIIFRKIHDNFGVIFKAQSIIAITNALLTTIGLFFIGYVAGMGAFPYTLTLALIVFILGFIPVFGMFLSSIPILLVALGNGGIFVAIACVGMITFVHAVEAYYLNPKIVSSFIHFPMFLTFIILLTSEHFFGLIGLLVGVPLFAIFISFLGDFNSYITQLQHEFINLNTRGKVEKSNP